MARGSASETAVGLQAEDGAQGRVDLDHADQGKLSDGGDEAGVMGAHSPLSPSAMGGVGAETTCDAIIYVFHQNDFVGRFLTHRLLGGVVEPHRKSLSLDVMDYLDLVHTVIKNPAPSSRRTTAQIHLGLCPR